MKTIVHVEDNYENRLLVRRILSAQGYTVVDLENAKEARTTLQSVRPDLILIDINMPDEDGYALTQYIKSINHLATIPIVAITANVMRVDRERAMMAGFDGYIEKPIDVDRFSDQILDFLNLNEP